MNGNLRENFKENEFERKHTPNVITTLRIKERKNLLRELNAYESHCRFDFVYFFIYALAICRNVLLHFLIRIIINFSSILKTKSRLNTIISRSI